MGWKLIFWGIVIMTSVSVVYFLQVQLPQVCRILYTSSGPFGLVCWF